MEEGAVESVVLSLDITDEQQLGRFPRHGWATNSQGVKLLWFPLKTLFNHCEALRHLKGATVPLRTPPGQHERAMRYSDRDPGGMTDRDVFLEPGPASPAPFSHGVFMLALCLRELHKMMRRRAEIPIFTVSAEQTTEIYEAQLLAPIFITAAYTQVRSLIDLLIFHARFALFDRYDQAPETFTDLRKKVSTGRQIDRAKPLINIKELDNVLNAASWFDLLRAPEGAHRGVRDRLLHTNTRIIVGSSQAGDQPPTFTAFMSSDVHQGRELIATLKTIVAGFCELCTDIHSLFKWSQGYQRMDNIFAFGNDEDVTGFWPEI